MLELARLSDQSAVNTLARQVHALHVSWRPDIYEMADRLYPVERMEETIRLRQLFVARLDGEVVGYVLLKRKDYDCIGHVKRNVMVVDEFCVAQNCRNRGIGSAMMAEVRVLAKAFGCTDLQLGVYPQNDAAVSFYQKCGFTIRSIDMQRKV